jgi:hypothetical protein
MAFPAAEPAAAFLSSFGAMVEALEPPQVRVELARRGAELVRLYTPGGRKEKGRPRSRPAG